MLEDAIEVFRLDRVEDVEEVLARGTFACGICVGELLREVRVPLDVGPKRLDGEFVVVRNSDALDVGLLHQLLLAR